MSRRGAEQGCIKLGGRADSPVVVLVIEKPGERVDYEDEDDDEEDAEKEREGSLDNRFVPTGW